MLIAKRSVCAFVEAYISHFELNPKIRVTSPPSWLTWEGVALPDPLKYLFVVVGGSPADALAIVATSCSKCTWAVRSTAAWNVSQLALFSDSSCADPVGGGVAVAKRGVAAVGRAWPHARAQAKREVRPG